MQDNYAVNVFSSFHVLHFFRSRSESILPTPVCRVQRTRHNEDKDAGLFVWATARIKSV